MTRVRTVDAGGVPETNDSVEEAILRVAAQLFAEKGFGETSTRAIAAAAGRAQSNLFYYFRSKQEIMLAIADRAMAVPLAALADAVSVPASAELKLYRVAFVHTLYICKRPVFLRAIRADIEGVRWSDSTRYRHDLDGYDSGIREVIEEGMRTRQFAVGDPHVTTQAVVGLLNSVLAWFDPAGPLTAEETSHLFARFVLRLVGTDASRFEELAEQADVGALAASLDAAID